MKKLTALLFWVGILLSGAATATIINSLPYNLTNGSLADATQVMANYNQIVNNTNTNAAHNGANTDITSITGLTTPLANTYGGTVVYTGGTTGGTQNAQTLTVVPSNFALTIGNIVTGVAGFTNSGAATLAVNGGAATAIRAQTSAGLVALTGFEIVTGQAYAWMYDGTYFELLNSSVTQGTDIAQGTIANSKLALMSNNTFKGNISGGNASPSDLSLSSTQQALNAVITVKRQVIASTTTYTPCTGLVYGDYEVWGGGGAGGGTNTSTGAAGGGGAAGGYARKVVAAATVGGSQSITIGAAGSGSSSADGGSGGTTSMGALISATGGGGGKEGTAATAAPAAGGSGGTGSSGDINMTGAPGMPSNTPNIATDSTSGTGGSTSLGGGGLALVGTANTPGNAAATNSGSGGSGAITAGSAEAGGAGAKGLFVATEYCNQ